MSAVDKRCQAGRKGLGSASTRHRPGAPSAHFISPAQRFYGPAHMRTRGYMLFFWSLQFGFVSDFGIRAPCLVATRTEANGIQQSAFPVASDLSVGRLDSTRPTQPLAATEFDLVHMPFATGAGCCPGRCYRARCSLPSAASSSAASKITQPRTTFCQKC